jgi:hypothetical protein
MLLAELFTLHPDGDKGTISVWWKLQERKANNFLGPLFDERN